MKYNFTKNKQTGFTLIELLVVIAIIGLLVVIVMISMQSAQKKARDARRKADVRQAITALQQYEVEYGSYPVTCCGFSVTFNNPILSELVVAGFLGTNPYDPINNSSYYYGYGGDPGSVVLAGCPPTARAVIKYYAETLPAPGYDICFANDPGRIGQCTCLY